MKENGAIHNRTIKKERNFRLPAQMYFIVLYLVVFCLLFPLISFYFLRETNTFRDNQIKKAVEARKSSLEDKATFLTRLISHNGSLSISEYNFSFLNDVIQETVSNDPDLLGCKILAKDISSSITAGIGVGDINLQSIILKAWQERKDLLHFPLAIMPAQALPVVKLDLLYPQTSSKSVLLFVAPIYVGDRFWGTVNAVFSLENLQNDATKIEKDWLNQIWHYKISLISFGCLFVLLGGLFAYLFTRPLIKSLYLLRDGVNLVANGKLEHHIDERRMYISEVLSLSRSFNAMTNNLRTSRRQLDDYSHSLEDKVEERTQELQEAQKELVNQAHEAGMAEMAVGVLHNIGNAITPAKVSATLLTKKLAKSPLRNNLEGALQPLATILQDLKHIDKKTRERMLTIISLLPASIREEYDKSVDALEGIVTKHEYIEGIINLQMRYAKVQDIAGLVEVNRVLRDALKMMNDLIVKFDVDIETDFGSVPPVRIEENKLLQIVINIIKNSCEAMDNVVGRKRILSISTKLDKDVVIISIGDTGCGFSPEVRESLFSFGYSTKKRSSGYGLHSSANYLIANNGSIEAVSEGSDQGAEFRIRLQKAVVEQMVRNNGQK